MGHGLPRLDCSFMRTNSTGVLEGVHLTADQPAPEAVGNIRLSSPALRFLLTYLAARRERFGAMGIDLPYICPIKWGAVRSYSEFLNQRIVTE